MASCNCAAMGGACSDCTSLMSRLDQVRFAILDAILVDVGRGAVGADIRNLAGAYAALMGVQE